MVELPKGFLMRSDPKKGGKPRWKVAMFDVGPREHLHLVLLNKDFDWFDMHWGGRFHVPCTRKLGVCAECKKHKPFKPEGYISAMPVGGGAVGILHVTYHMHVNENRFRQRGNLRGVEIEVWRGGDSYKSRRYIRVQGETPHILALPTALDVERFIEQMYSGTVIDGLPLREEVPA